MVSAFSVALVVIVAGLMYLYGGADFPIALMAVIVGVLSVLLSPLNFRFSRIVWLNLFVHYDPDSKNALPDRNHDFTTRSRPGAS